MNIRRNHDEGAINASIFAISALVLLVIVFGSFSIWAYINYTAQKQDVDSKIAEATAKAVLDQSNKDETAFSAREKEPMRQFVGPSDYGRLTFDYPKTWSAYQATDVSMGGGAIYQAYLNPILVPPVSPTTKFAVRITIEQKTYDQSLATYQQLIQKGDLKSSVYSQGNLTGTELVGNFNSDIYGTAVLMKMRDRTLTLRTDGDVFNSDFLALLKTVNFNQ